MFASSKAENYFYEIGDYIVDLNLKNKIGEGAQGKVHPCY